MGLKVVDFLFERARREADSWYASDHQEKYDAIPSYGLPYLWGALQRASNYRDVVSRVLEGSAAAELRRRAGQARGEQAWYRDERDIVRQIVRWDDVVESVIREWMDAGQCEQVGALNQLLSDQHPLFIVERQDFVTDLVEWSARCSPGDRQYIKDALLSPMEIPVARQIGKAHPVYEDVRVKAQNVARELLNAGKAVAAAVYFKAAANAEERIQRDAMRDEGRLLPADDDDDFLVDDSEWDSFATDEW